MDAAALGDVEDLDFDLGFLDGFECFDFDFDLLGMDLTEFCGGEGKGERLLPAVDNKDDGLRLDLGSDRDGEGDGGEGGRESSPDSLVTDDGAPPLSSGSSLVDRDDGEMSAYVTDLERFLLQDDGEPGGLFAAKDPAPDDNLFNDLADGGYVAPSIAAEEFAADDHFFGDVDDGYAEPATPGKDLVINDYFFGDVVVAGDGYIQPSTAGEDLVSDDYFDDAAGEDDDEATSRKRARQRKATAVMLSETEPRETPMMHAISSSISTGNWCRPIDLHWLHPCTTVCLLA
ncbi:hypothetical protein ZWY2020_012760 [Hordeum vulgare]|nr:hypothetical protein ZWY2020_012760 [Hordeum vulgare]